MAKKHKKPERTPVTGRKRKKGVAKRPPPETDPCEELVKDIKPRSEKAKRSWADTPKKSEGLELLKRISEIRFVTDPNGISVREMSEIEPFNAVHHATLRNWCSSDGWVEKRTKYFDGISDGIKKKLGKRLISIQVEQLKELDALYHDAIGKLKAEKLKPKSLEGMITALVKLVTSSNELRDRIAREIVPANLGGTRDEGMQVTPKLTESEARAAAMAIIHERRAKMRAAATDSDDDEKPQLRVVDGGAGE